MRVVGCRSAYALEINDSGLIQSLFYHGEKIDFLESSQANFNDTFSYPVFNWDASPTPVATEGPNYVVIQNGGDSQRRLELSCLVEGGLLLTVQVENISDNTYFKFPIKKDNDNNFAFDNESQNDWEVNVASNSEFSNNMPILSPFIAAFMVKKKLIPLTIVISDDAAEAAEIIAQVSNGKFSVLVIPEEYPNTQVSVYGNSPMMRAIFQQKNFRITSSDKHADKLVETYGEHFFTVKGIVQNHEWTGEVRTPTQTLPEALLLARLGKLRLIVDEEASPVEPIRRERMVYYVGDGINALAAANYAFDTGAGLQRIISPNEEWITECLECIQNINSAILSGTEGNNLASWMTNRFFEWAKRTIGLTKQDSITDIVDRILDRLKRVIQEKYQTAFDGATEACVFWDAMDVPLSLGIDIPIGHLPIEASPYVVSREIRRARETQISPLMLTINTPGLDSCDATWALNITKDVIEPTNWYVSVFDTPDFPPLLLRYYPSDIYYFITHGSPGAMSIGNNATMLAKELAEFKLTSSPFIINNSCVSWPKLGAAALRSGATGYVGTLWPVRAGEAVELGAKFLKFLQGGVETGQALYEASRCSPSRERTAFFLVGSPFNYYPPSVVTTEAERKILHLHSLGRSLAEQSEYLAILTGTNSDAKLNAIIFPLLLFAGGKNSIIYGWDWIHMARDVSITLMMSNPEIWQELKQSFFDHLEMMIDEIAYDENWSTQDIIEGSRSSFADFVFQYTTIMTKCAWNAEDWKSYNHLLEIQRTYCEEWGHGYAYASILNNLAKGLLKLEKFDEAEKLIEDSINAKKEKMAIPALAESFLTLSILKQARGNHKEAIEYLDGYLEFLTLQPTTQYGVDNKRKHKYLLALSNRATSFIALGKNIDKAFEDLDIALNGFARLNLPVDVLKSYVQLYDAHMTVCNHEIALEFLEMANELAQQIEISESLRKEIETRINYNREIQCKKDDFMPTYSTNAEDGPQLIGDYALQQRAEILGKKAISEGTVQLTSPSIALIYYSIKKWQQALLWFKKWDAGGFDISVLGDSHIPLALVAYMNVAIELCSDNEVEALSRSLTSRFPNVAELWAEVGKWQHLKDRDSEAKQCLQTALKLDPNNIAAVANLSEYLAKEGDVNGAINLLLPVALNEHSAELFYRLGDLYCLKPDFERAKRFFEDSAILGNSDALLPLVEIYAHQKNFLVATQKLTDYLHQNPRHREAWIRLCALKFKDGSYEKALDAATVALFLGMRERLAIIQWAGKFIQVKDLYPQVAKRYELAMSSIKEIPNLNSMMQNASAEEFIHNLALTYVKNRSYFGGIICCCVHSSNGDWELAQKVATEQLEMHPDDFLIQLMLLFLTIYSGKADTENRLLEVRNLFVEEEFYYTELLGLAETMLCANRQPPN